MEKYKKADLKNPFMGLNNQVCKDPKYWCRLYQVWLSKEDVEKKKCRQRPTYDMISTYSCKCLEERL